MLCISRYRLQEQVDPQANMWRQVPIYARAYLLRRPISRAGVPEALHRQSGGFRGGPTPVCTCVINT